LWVASPFSESLITAGAARSDRTRAGCAAGAAEKIAPCWARERTRREWARGCLGARASGPHVSVQASYARLARSGQGKE